MSKIELYDKKFVHFMWDDELNNKAVTTGEGIDSLIAQVNRGTSSATVHVRENPDSEFPFYEIETHRIYRFAYYDPNYECKRAYAEGKQIQLKSYGKWHDITDPSWSDGEEYRIKTEEKKLKWTDLKIGDVITNGRHTAMVTEIDKECTYQIHIYAGNQWLKDSDLVEWEKVEESE